MRPCDNNDTLQGRTTMNVKQHDTVAGDTRTPKEQFVEMLQNSIPTDANSFSFRIEYDTVNMPPVFMESVHENAQVTIGYQNSVINERRVRIELRR